MRTIESAHEPRAQDSGRKAAAAPSSVIGPETPLDPQARAAKVKSYQPPVVSRGWRVLARSR